MAVEDRIRRLTRAGEVSHTVPHENSNHQTSPPRLLRHDFGTVLAWVAEGEEVTVLNRTRPVARICPPRAQAPAKFKMPDFAARAKAIFGDKIIPNMVLLDREESRW